MDPDRKHQILAAEDAYINTERLARALAENGFYVIGKLSPSASDIAVERRPLEAMPDPERGGIEAATSDG